MNFGIVTTSPSWLIFVCIIVGILFTTLLYYKNKRQEFPSKYLWLLMLLRFLSTTLISFLLLTPLIKSSFKRVEKPIIIFAQDNSASIIANKDSLFYNTDYKKKIEQLKNKFSSEYDFRYFNFSNSISTDDTLNFSGKQTNISQIFSDFSVRFANRNVGALILASDGIYNAGLNPLYLSNKLSFPIYTVALGDTTVRRDISISKINYNKIAYLGNTFPIEINLKTWKCKGLKTEIRVYCDKELLYSKPVLPLNNNFSESITVMLEAKKTGMQRYSVVIDAVEGENIIQNNTSEIFIQILDSRRKVLILGSVPHPDMAALKNAINSNFNYEAESYTLDEFQKTVENYDIIILHQIPYINNPAIQLIEKINKAEIPVLYILGPKSNLSVFNSLKAGLTVTAGKAGFNESVPAYDNNFALFTIDASTQKLFSELPPLICQFGTYKVMNSATVMLYQKIGKIISEQPLVLFNDISGQRNGVICGTGIWRWRIINYIKMNNHDAFNEFISKILQYLSVKSDKSKFRIAGKHNFVENEMIMFNAEVYNDAYELINDPEIEFIIKDTQGNNFRYTFDKSDNAYVLNAGFFPVGEYSYTAKVKVGDKIYTANGIFIVSKLNAEYLNTVADHTLLYNMAKRNNGEMIYPARLETLYDLIKSKDEIKPVSYIEKKYDDAINAPWVLGIIILLLSIEWFIRKYMGGY